MERDICGLVLSTDVRVHQPFVDEAGIDRLFIAKHASKVTPVATRIPSENPDLQDAEVERVCFDNFEASAEAQKGVLSEMLRLEESIEK